MKSLADIKLEWQKHNRDHGMSWNEVAELIKVINAHHTREIDEGEKPKTIRKGCPTCQHDDYNSGRNPSENCPHAETCGPAFKHWEESPQPEQGVEPLCHDTTELIVKSHPTPPPIIEERINTVWATHSYKDRFLNTQMDENGFKAAIKELNQR